MPPQLAALLLLLVHSMASSSASAFECACRGVRGDDAGLREIMQLRFGGSITVEDVFNVEVQPALKDPVSFTAALDKMEREQGEAAAAAWLNQLKARAATIHEEKGGLYTGHMDHVRSAFCNIDAGSVGASTSLSTMAGTPLSG